MPYVLRKQSRRGYKVCKKGTRKCFSKRALTKRMAVRQMRALYLNESKKQSGKQSKKQSGKQSKKQSGKQSKKQSGGWGGNIQQQPDEQ